MSSSPYEIFVKIGIKDYATPALMSLGRLAGDLDKTFKNLASSVANLDKSWKPLMQTGGLFAASTGTAIAGFLLHATSHAEKLLHVQQQMITAGIKQQEIAEATAAAWKNQADLGVKVADALADIKESRLVFGSTEESIKFSTDLERMRVVLDSVRSGRGGEAKDAIFQMARAGELKGAQRPEDFHRLFDMMTRAVSASGGQVDPKAFLQAAKYGRLATVGWSDDFFTKTFPALIQEMGPSQAGTAAMSLFGTLAQGKVSKRALEAMIARGLIGDPSKIIYNKVGPAGFRFGAIKDSNLLVSDPFAWAQTVMRPALVREFGEAAVEARDPKVIGALGEMVGNRTSAQMMAALTMRGWAIRRDQALVGQALGLEAADRIIKQDPTAVMNRFTAAWDALMTHFGQDAMGPRIGIINALTGALNKLNSVDAGTFSKITEGLMITAGALTAAGTASLLAALGPYGWLAAGIVALGGAAIAFGPAIVAFTNMLHEMTQKLTERFVKGLMNSLQSISDAIVSFAAKLRDIGSSIWNVITSLGGLLNKTSFGGGDWTAGAGLQHASFGGGGGGLGSFRDAGGMQPYFKTRLDAMMAEAHATGHPLSVFSGYRSQAHQNALFARSDHSGHWVARHSRHTMGIAADLRGDLGWAHRNAGRFGLHFPMPWERWHIEPTGPNHGRIGTVRPFSGGRGGALHVHNQITLDGKVVAANVTRHQLKASQFATRAPHFNGSGLYAGPDRLAVAT